MGKKLQKKAESGFLFVSPTSIYGGHMSQMLLRCDHSGSRVQRLQTMKHYGKSVSLFVLEVLSLALLQEAGCGVWDCPLWEPPATTPPGVAARMQSGV
jgi:hypothetical protein